MTTASPTQTPHAAQRAERQRARYWAQKTGRYTPHFIPDEPVRRHIEILVAGGLSLAAIARAAGLSRLTMHSIVREGHATIAPETARKILAVRGRLADFPDEALIPAIGTTRRLQALACLGWTSRALADQTGVSRTMLTKIRAGELKRVRAGMARAVAGTYQRLSGVQAPAGPGAARSRTEAAIHNWAPPAVWDAAAIDDPSVEPEPAPMPRLEAVVTEAEFLAAQRLPQWEIAKELGLTLNSLQVYLRRAASTTASEDPS